MGMTRAELSDVANQMGYLLKPCYIKRSGKPLTLVETKTIIDNANKNYGEDANTIIKFALKIQQQLIKTGDTQEFVAEVLGISPNAMYKYRNGLANPTLITLKKMADYFGVEIGEFLKD